MSGVDIAGIVERLRKPIYGEELMKRWDRWRKMHKDGFGGSATRDEFESVIDSIDEERSETADALLAQAAELAAARGEVEDQTREVAVLWEENRAYENDWDLMEKSQADALRAAESATRQRDEALAALKASEEREAGLRANLDEIAKHSHAIANIIPRGALRPSDPGTEQREAGV